MHRVALKGFNDDNTCSEIKYFVIQGNILDTCEDIHRQVFSNYSKLLIEEIKELDF